MVSEEQELREVLALSFDLIVANGDKAFSIWFENEAEYTRIIVRHKNVTVGYSKFYRRTSWYFFSMLFSMAVLGEGEVRERLTSLGEKQSRIDTVCSLASELREGMAQIAPFTGLLYSMAPDETDNVEKATSGWLQLIEVVVSDIEEHNPGEEDVKESNN